MNAHDMSRSDSLESRVRQVVASVPRGTVATYGDVAALAGTRNARAIGRVLAAHGHDLPWWRIVNARGEPPRTAAAVALARLREEGIPMTGSGDSAVVDLAVARWAAS